MFNFDTLYGTPLIYVLVFGATATKFVLDYSSKHPALPDKSLICWDLVVLSMPAMLAGKILGLMANIIFPEWLIVLIFITVMINDFIGTFKYYTGIAPQHPCGCSAPTSHTVNTTTANRVNQKEDATHTNPNSNNYLNNGSNANSGTEKDNLKKECGATGCRGSVN